MGWVANATSGRLTPEKETRYPLHKRLGGPQGRSEVVQKISPPTGIPSPHRPVRGELLHCSPCYEFPAKHIKAMWAPRRISEY